jgi:hypothetical protein
MCKDRGAKRNKKMDFFHAKKQRLRKEIQKFFATWVLNLAALREIFQTSL